MGTLNLGSNGTITNLAVGGLPDGTVDNDTLANNASDSAEIAAGAVDLAHLSATGTASSSTFLRGDNAWAAPGGGGKVLQYKYALGDMDQINMTTTSWHEVDTDMQVAITPTATSNLIIAFLFVNPAYGNNEAGSIIPAIHDGSSNISMVANTNGSGGETAANVLGGTGPQEAIRTTQSSAWYFTPMTIIGKHTAANTNEHTVKMYGKFVGWDNGIIIGDSTITSQMVVMEVDMS